MDLNITFPLGSATYWNTKNWNLRVADDEQSGRYPKMGSGSISESPEPEVVPSGRVSVGRVLTENAMKQPKELESTTYNKYTC